MSKPLSITASLLLLAALAFAQTESPAPKAVPDTTLGLSKTSVFDSPSPPPVVPETADPGDRPPLPRAYPGAPPRIPHAVADFLPITRGENLCIDCHLVDEKVEGEPTPIPASHKTDLRRSPGEAGEKVVGARWVCLTCHVPRTGAGELVENRFGR